MNYFELLMFQEGGKAIQDWIGASHKHADRHKTWSYIDKTCYNPPNTLVGPQQGRRPWPAVPGGRSKGLPRRRKGYTRLDRGHPQTCRSPQDLFLHRQDMLQPSKHSWATTRETSMTCGVWWSLEGPSEKEERLYKTGSGPPTDMPIATRLVLT